MNDIEKMRAELAVLMTFPLVAQVIRAIELREAIAQAERDEIMEQAESALHEGREWGSS